MKTEKPKLPISVELSKLYTKAFKEMANSPRQLAIRKQIDELRAKEALPC